MRRFSYSFPSSPRAPLRSIDRALRMGTVGGARDKTEARSVVHHRSGQGGILSRSPAPQIMTLVRSASFLGKLSFSLLLSLASYLSWWIFLSGYFTRELAHRAFVAPRLSAAKTAKAKLEGRKKLAERRQITFFRERAPFAAAMSRDEA